MATVNQDLTGVTSGSYYASAGNNTIYTNLPFNTAGSTTTNVTFFVGASSSIDILYNQNFRVDTTPNFHELFGNIEVQGVSSDYTVSSWYGKVTLTHKTSGQVISFQLTKPMMGPPANNSGVNVEFLDGAIAFTSNVNGQGVWTVWATQGGTGTSTWGQGGGTQIPGTYSPGATPLDLSVASDVGYLNYSVNSSDVSDWTGTGSGATYTLTTNIDNFTGTIYDDTFNAYLSGSTMTLNALDSLNGNGGTDTLYAQINADVTPLVLDNIEIVYVTNSDTTAGAETLGLVNAGELEEVINYGSAGPLIVTGIAAGADLAVVQTAGATTFTYADATGTSDTANLEVAAVTSAAAITIDGIETIAITATGTSVYQLDADAATTVTFAGSSNQTVTLNAATANVTSFNGAASTGNLNLTLINGTPTTVSVTGGTGNDTFTIGAEDAARIVSTGNGDDTVVINSVANGLKSTDSLTGGNGTDTLSMLAGVTTTAAGSKAIGFETLTFADNAANAVSQNMAAFTASTFTQVNNGKTSGDALTISNAGASLATLGVNASTVSTLTRATDTSSDALTIAIANTGSAVTATSVTANNEESITINSTKTGGSAANAITALAGSDLTSLTVTGNANLGSTTVTAANLATVTSTAFTGTLNLTASTSTVNLTANLGDTNTTLTSGSGNDIINGGAGNDSLSGGAGNDSITGGNGSNTLVAGAGSDTLIGGTGTDTFTFGTNLSNGDSVVGGAGNDTLTATLSSGTVTPVSINGVETLTITASGGALNAANITGTTLLNVSSTATTSISGLSNSVATIQQQSNTVPSAVSYRYATGADATVLLTTGTGTAAVENSGTTMTNVQSLTISGDNAAFAFNTGNLTVDSNLETLTLNTLNALAGATSASTLTVGTITGATGLQTLDINADEGNITVSTAGDSTLAGLETISVSTLDADGDVDLAVGQIITAINLQSLEIVANAGDVAVGQIGTATAGTESDQLTTLSITASNSANVTVGALFVGDSLASSSLASVAINGGTGNTFAIGAMDATGADIASYTLNTGADTAANTFGAVTADSVTAIDVTVGDGGATYAFAAFDVATIGSVTVDADDAVTFGVASTSYLGATSGTIGDITVSGSGVVTLYSGAVTSVGNVDTTGSDANNVITLNNSTLIGTIMTSGDGDNAFTGTGGADNITMGAGDDTVYGGSGGDVITGAAGEDSLNGGAGVDSIDGGANNDIIFYTVGTDMAAGETINGGANTDTLKLAGTSQTYAINATTFSNVEAVNTASAVTALAATFTNAQIAGISSITGGTATETFNVSGTSTSGTTAINLSTITLASLTAGTDKFVVNGAAIDGGTGYNVTTSDLGDTVTLTNGANSITGGAGGDSLTGGSGVDSIAGGSGDDTLVGGAADDIIDGETGTDVIRFANTLVSGTAGSVAGVDASVGTDAITFVVADDQFQVDITVFGSTAGTAGGTLAANQFGSVAGTAAAITAPDVGTGDIGFVIDTSANDLYFIEAGATFTSGVTTLADLLTAGDAYKIADLTLTGTLAATDFSIIA